MFLLFSLLFAKATTEVNTVFPVNFLILFHEFCPYSAFFTQCIFGDSSRSAAFFGNPQGDLVVHSVYLIHLFFHVQSQKEPLKITKLHM